MTTTARSKPASWEILPGEVHVLTAKLPPGEHELEVIVRDRSGADLPELSSVLQVTVREGRLAFAWTRAAPRPPVRAAPGDV